MDLIQGKLLAVYVLATVLAGIAAWVLSRRYRQTIVRLMRAPQGQPAARTDAVATAVGVAQATAELPSWLAPTVPTLDAWRRAEWRLIAVLAGLSLAMAATRGALVQVLWVDGAWSWPRWALFTAIFAWPILPAVAALQRWSRLQFVGSLLAWFAVAFVLAMLRSEATQQARTVLLWLALEIGPPALAFVLLTLKPTRAAAPWLWPPLALLVCAALLGLDGLGWIAQHHLDWFSVLPEWVEVWWIFAAFALTAIAFAWWPVMRFARWLALAYARRRISDLMIVFSAAWALNLGWDALSSGPLVLLPLVWIALALALLRQRAPARPAPAPTLLVLRVFKQDANVAALFDDVVERWRSVGNTVLIAGTDLVDHTLDAADLFDFIDGRLAARFVQRAADVPQRMAAFEWLPDAEGRWRVNECYCHDHGWQVALAALVQRADLVLMDLRGFQAHNAGCRFELGVLARASHLTRVVVLTDDHTDLSIARADAAGAPPGRFAWIDLGASTPSRRRLAQRVRAALAGTTRRAARVTRLRERPS